VNQGKQHGLPNSSRSWDNRQAHSEKKKTFLPGMRGPSHIPSHYGYMFLRWEKIGVRLRYAGTHGKGQRKNSITIFVSSLPMSPHTPQPNINLLSPPKTYTDKSWPGTSLQRPCQGGGLPTHPVVLPWDLRWKQSCTWNSSVQELECYIDSVKLYEKS